ncbi:hypothetical protein LJC16_02135 [Bacteroidales bacterium OttesenSCG-928-C19]|nr:hypothetical protein [Bacteroidales bacterium OttesenSCG-928-C19]
MKKLFTIILSLFLFTACKTSKMPVQVPVEKETIITERLVPVVNPADSLLLQLLLECDSLGNVRLQQLNETKTNGIESNLSLANNKLDYTAGTKRDTVYVPVKDTSRTGQIPIYVDVPGETIYKTTLWQSIQINGFWVLLIILVIIIKIKKK